MGVLDKLAKAREATGSSNNKPKSFMNKKGLWVTLEEGDNVVRLGGNVVVCERHYVPDLVNPDSLKSKGEDRPTLSKNTTCLNWDIDKQQKISEELHCCAICDLRTAANVRRREAKESKDKDQEDKMKELSGKAYARSRYSWDAISRADPMVQSVDQDGNESACLGWKILNLGAEGTEAIEALAKQYPQIADPDEGCDIVVSKHKSTRITYGASFALNGPNIAITPLTDEEKEMEKMDLLRYIASHVSPRALFESLKPAYQELIEEVLGKTADDYPSEPPVKKQPRNIESSSESSDDSDSSATPKKEPVRKRAVDVSDEFEEVSSEDSPEPKNDTFDEDDSEEDKKPSAPKRTASKPGKPKPPKKPSPPKPPKKKEAEEEKEEEQADESDDDINVTPACFGYYDESEEECQSCKGAEKCKEQTDG